jgi:hypothetical protein
MGASPLARGEPENLKSFQIFRLEHHRSRGEEHPARIRVGRCPFLTLATKASRILARSEVRGVRLGRGKGPAVEIGSTFLSNKVFSSSFNLPTLALGCSKVV